MAYNTKKGKQQSGDIQFESDPTDTQIDFENDFVAIKTNAQQRFIVSGSFITASVAVSSSAGISAGSFSTLGAITSATVSGSGLLQGSGLRIDTNGIIGTAGDTNLLTLTNNQLTVAGVVSGSGAIQGAALNVGGSQVLTVTKQLSNIASLDATTETTIEGAIDTLANLTSYGSNGVETRALGSLDVVGGIQINNVNFVDASRNITGSGLLTNLAGIKLDTSAVIGTTGDTNLLTLNNNQLLVAGQLSASTDLAGRSLILDVGKAIGIAGDTDLVTLTANTVTVAGALTASTDLAGRSLLLDTGKTIGITGDTNLMTLTANKVSVAGVMSSSAGITGSAIRADGDLKVNGSITGSGFSAFLPGIIIDTNALIGTAGDPDLLQLANGQLNVAGAISGSKGLFHVTNGTLQLGNEEVGTGVMLKIRGPSDNSVPLLIKTPGHETILACTGSGQVVVGAAYFGAKLNVSGSDPNMLIQAKSDNANPAFYVSGSGDAYVSGSLRARQLYMHTHKMNFGDTTARFVRFDSNGGDTSAGGNNKMVAPYPGKLVKVIVRSLAGPPGSTVVSLHSASNGTTNVSATAAEAITVNCSAVDTSFVFTFTDAAAWPVSGDIVGIKINPTTDPGTVVATSVWEYDQNQ